MDKETDFVPVVRCKDCKHLTVWNNKLIYAMCDKLGKSFKQFSTDTNTSEFFCAFGERKEQQ